MAILNARFLILINHLYFPFNGMTQIYGMMQKTSFCWQICNSGNKIVRYKKNGIHIALHCGDHCAWKYWIVSVGFHHSNSHCSSKCACSLSRKMYIWTNQVAHLCEMTVWNVETQHSGHVPVWMKVQVNCLLCTPQSKGNVSLKRFWQIKMNSSGYLSSS